MELQKSALSTKFHRYYVVISFIVKEVEVRENGTEAKDKTVNRATSHRTLSREQEKSKIQAYEELWLAWRAPKYTLK